MVNAEHALLGCLLLDPREFRNVQGLVTGEHFQDARLGEVFDLISGMSSRREAIDSITVAARIPEAGIRLDPTVVYEWTSVPTVPMLARSYAEIVLEQFLRRGLQQVATKLHEGAAAGRAPTDLIEQASHGLSELRASRSAEIPRGFTGEELVQMEDSYDWVVPGLLERQDRLIVTGGEGGGKTEFVRQLAVAAALGRHPLEVRNIEPKRVLIIDAENRDMQWSRNMKRWAPRAAQELGVQGSLANMKMHPLPRLDLRRDSDLATVHRLIDDFDPAIVAIGPLYRIAGPTGIDNDKDAAPVLAALDTIRDRGLAMLMEAHAGHATNKAGDRDLRPRGSSQQLGWPEFGFGLRKSKKDNRVVDLVRWRGDRDSRSWPTQLRRYGWNQVWPFVPNVQAEDKEAA